MNELGPFTFWELFALALGVSVIIGVGGVFVAHKWLRGRLGDAHNDVVVALYATAAVIYAVLIAFLVIAVWESYSAAKDNVANEASELSTMYRETEAMPAVERSAIRPLIRDYTEAVIKEEWKVQASGGQSSAAREAIVKIYRVLAAQAPHATSPVTNQFVDDLSMMTSDRTKRVLATQDQIPWILWLGLLAGGLVVVLGGGVLYMENVRLHAAFSGVVAGLIGVLLFSTVVLDRPFEGKFAIKPDAFEHAFSVYQSVDQTPV